MLWMVAVVLIILWMLGLMSGYAMGYFTHLALFFAIIVMLVQVEDDCSDYESGHATKMYLKRQLMNGPGMLLPKLVISDGKVSQTIILPRTYREE